MKLQKKNVMITGASSGIGQAIAIRFAGDGANVAINYRNGVEQAEATREMARRARPDGAGKQIVIQADVSDEAQVKAMVSKVIEEFGSLDVLVNNAGIQKAAASHEIESSDFDRVLAVNLRGPFLCSREAIRHYLNRGGGGVILNNSSGHEIIPKPKYLPYSISKGGMENLTKSLALEYAAYGIRVNSVGPGAVVTPINKAWVDNPSQKYLKFLAAVSGQQSAVSFRRPSGRQLKCPHEISALRGVTSFLDRSCQGLSKQESKARGEVESHIPMSRPAEAGEIAAVFAFLASDDASYVTGQTIFACGGLTLYPEFRTAWSSGE